MARELSRAISFALIFVAFALLNLLGRVYHQWLLAGAAVIVVFALREVVDRALVAKSQGPGKRGKAEEAVVVYLKGAPSPEEREAESLEGIEADLQRVLAEKQLGEYDGNQVGEGGATLFMYGPSADRLFAGVEPTLRTHALCRNALVRIRPGPPGTPFKEVRL